MAYSPRSVDKLRIRDARAAELDVRGPLSTRPTATASAPKGDGLTRRERKVKAILLQELNKINGSTKTWAAYKERKHLADTLDVAYIDREMARMERDLRRRSPLVWFLPVYLMLLIGDIGQIADVGLTWSTALNLLVIILGAVGIAGSVVYNRRATQRRLWIYQALRELSDADDEGVQLDESVRLADLLIDRIIDQEEGAAPAPLHRIRIH